MRKALAVALLSLAAFGAKLAARDVPEPPLAANPSYISDSEGFLSGGYHDFGYLRNVFRSGAFDLFSLRQRSTVLLYSSDAFSISLRYGSVLFVGPVEGEIKPGSPLAPWYMHSIQFEYGVAVGLSPFRIPLAMTAEYARTSQHPLMRGFSEVSSDVVSIGLWYQLEGSPEAPRATFGAKFEYVDLLDLWQSTLRAPRTALRVEGQLHGAYRVPSVPAIEFFTRMYPRLLVLRSEDQWEYADIDPRVQLEGEGELGVAFTAAARVELFGFFYATQDTEQRRGEAVPSTVFGLGIRFSTPTSTR